jgi:hypothetical protein
MKKSLMIGAIAIAVVAVLALGVTGWAYAQDGQPVAPYNGGGGWMGGRGMHGWAGDGQYGPMHDYMFPAMADAFGLTEAELQAAHDEGKTLWDIAQEQGLTFEEFQTRMLEARRQAFEQMVAEGVISQEQASWMLERMSGARSGGYGPGMMGGGGCGGYPSAGFGSGMRNGGRWNNQP